MAIIDNAQMQQGQAPAQPMPGAPAGPQPGAPAAQPGAQPGKGPSKEARSVILAVYGMLYDKRVALGEKIGEQIMKARDPVAIIANNAYDLVVSAIEKTQLPLDKQNLVFAISVTLRRLIEIAQAVGVQLDEQAGKDASEMITQRITGQGGPQGGPPPGAPPQPGAEQPGAPVPAHQGAMA